ncbi:hypothetical protein LP316_12830 [Thalassotalea sp. LPB0316]|uniref:hypothetical protein n=1 Tax=Thalassotalea sp. LPB0316 TaxID=2769490 RepID=UPI00186622D4|nr:hypothetical protein [Thalassotalea sp. LPB0316]QOL25175.1 hypothetical protein LP316_12830 [Thalassotalea sp. LPB0316]
MSDYTIALIIIVVVILFLIGNFSTVQKTAKKPLRKKSLNELEETLPRSQKKKHVMPPVHKK